MALLTHIFLSKPLTVTVLITTTGHRAILSHIAKVAAAAVRLHAGSVHATVFADRVAQACNAVGQNRTKNEEKGSSYVGQLLLCYEWMPHHLLKFPKHVRGVSCHYRVIHQIILPVL